MADDPITEETPAPRRADLLKYWPLLAALGVGGAAGTGAGTVDLLGVGALRADMEEAVEALEDDLADHVSAFNEHRHSEGHPQLLKRVDALEEDRNTLRVLQRNQLLICEALGVRCVEPGP